MTPIIVLFVRESTGAKEVQVNLDELMSSYSRFKSREDASHDLQQFKVNEILLVSSFYDAFIFEQDGVLSEQLIGEYHQLNLSFPPRITNATNGSEALAALSERSFDMVILTLRIGDTTAWSLSKRIKESHPDLPVLLLLNNPHDIARMERDRDRDRLRHIDDLFYWSGDSNVFLAMIKSIEDRRNLEEDTRNGLVRIILVIEDSPRHYSSFLPVLYSLIVKQTQQLISEEVTESARRSRMRMRPKVVLVHDFAMAEEILNEYRDFLICVITDVEFERGGRVDDQAGVRFIEQVRVANKTLPVLIQSSEPANAARAANLNSRFLDKNSPHMLNELRDFLVQELGFGDFVFRLESGAEIARAGSLQEFRQVLREIPDEAVLYHARNNHFSSWLVAHGEILYAKAIQPLQIVDFKNTRDLRRFLLGVFDEAERTKIQGRLVVLTDWDHTSRSQVVRVREGSLGGKGRGLAFMNTLIHALDFSGRFPDVDVTLPATAIIGTTEFDEFLERNRIDTDIASRSDDEIRAAFLAGRVSDELMARLWSFAEKIRYPVAIRSSGLLEDSQVCPLAGVYRTYMLPNRDPDTRRRFDELVAAIKLVFACVFEAESRANIQSAHYKLEEEKMAVVLQELVGNHHGGHFYPDVSGVAQSHNFYPTGPMKPGDGVANVALGLGRSVVEGRSVLRFCPRYPDLDLLGTDEMIRNSQREFWAIRMDSPHMAFLPSEDGTLGRLSLKDAEEHGTLDAVGSVWDRENERIVDGIHGPGVRLVTFANVLKYGQFPLAELLREFLTIGEKALGVPVEIEFAANLSRGQGGASLPGFYPLQIRPIHVDPTEVEVRKSRRDHSSDLLLYSEEAMGNGVFVDVDDVVFVDPETFRATSTVAIRGEIAAMNARMVRDGRRYILIGPGRWGSRDRFLGIPVLWSEISEARMMVETDLPDFRVESSQGSHFFHNLVARNVGYLKVRQDSETSWIDWDRLRKLPVIERTAHCVHARAKRPFLVRMDGRRARAVVRKG